MSAGRWPILPGRRRSLLLGAALAGLVLAGAAVAALQYEAAPPIRVGVLHSMTGTMAISELPVVDATLLAIEQINERGGLLGRPVEPIVADGASDPAAFARLAERLIVEDGAVTVFGCWTSASRKTVRPIFEKHDHLLVYPVQYEGLELSPNIVYTGAAPNQQILPAAKWALERFEGRVFLAGSDYVFPRTANAILGDQIAALGGQVLGEEYLPLGSERVEPLIEAIVATRPAVVFNTINGDSNLAFFRALRAAGFTAEQLPVLSFSLGENELAALPLEDVAGHYAAWNYFHSVDSPENHAFIHAFRQRYGPRRVTSDAMEAAYFGVHLWAQAVEAGSSAEVHSIRNLLRGQSWNAPQGAVYVDPVTQHTWKWVRIGQIQPDGQFRIVWQSARPVQPAPYPMSRQREQWDAFLAALHSRWGGQWAAPAAREAAP